MKLHKVKGEFNAFKKAVEQCKGQVWLETPEGDKFNLKSEFSYYIALGALLDEHGPDLELYCQYPTDEHFFYEFFDKYPEAL